MNAISAQIGIFISGTGHVTAKMCVMKIFFETAYRKTKCDMAEKCIPVHSNSR
jgi:hypothetical protein